MTETKILDRSSNREEIIDTAVGVLGRGGTIVYPTETVYGIGASLYNTKAVKEIYRIKSRTFNLPLTANVASIEQVYDIAVNIPDDFHILAQRFLPGPLTIILEKSRSVSDIVTSGMLTVGVRMPDHELFLDILEAFDLPVAGTSANISGRGSIVGVEKLKEEFNGKVDLIIDDGVCRIGTESTIISLVDKLPEIIRAGAVSAEDIELCLRKKIVFRKSIF